MGVELEFLELHRGEAPLILSLPHTGTDIPDHLAARYVSLWQARRDADWWIDQLYDFAQAQGITVLRTRVSRSVIDVNRDPSGASLYPGQATTGLCPLIDFDGGALYHPGQEPDEMGIEERLDRYFDPYHLVLRGEIARLRARHPRLVLYDAHSIRSRIPRLFEGVLPECNIGTNDGAAADPALTEAITRLCADAGYSLVVNGRFKGGYITRHYAAPKGGVHAVQMELACRAYMREPEGAISEANWPPDYDAAFAAPMRDTLRRIFALCLDFAAAKEC
jgi:N-formylglutamate deformylase